MGEGKVSLSILLYDSSSCLLHPIAYKSSINTVSSKFIWPKTTNISKLRTVMLFLPFA